MATLVQLELTEISAITKKKTINFGKLKIILLCQLS